MSKQTTWDKLDLLGVEVDAVTNAEAADYICARAAAGQPACYAVKPYVEFLDRAYRNPELTDLLNRAELAIPDGVALTWAAAYLYAGKRSAGRFWLTLSQIIFAPSHLRWPLPDRAAGTNFTWPLLEAAARANLRVCLIGDPQSHDISQTAHIISQKLPTLAITGALSGRDQTTPAGHVSDTWLAQTAAIVAEANPDITLVGMGFPLQEKVCAYLTGHAAHGVFIGEGGTFDYESFGGSRPKAPAAIQRIGLEWAWRLILEPQRVWRQRAIPRFIWRVWNNR